MEEELFAQRMKNSELRKTITDQNDKIKNIESDLRSAYRDTESIKKAVSVINALEFVLCPNIETIDKVNEMAGREQLKQPNAQLSRILNHLINILTRG